MDIGLTESAGGSVEVNPGSAVVSTETEGVVGIVALVGERAAQASTVSRMTELARESDLGMGMKRHYSIASSWRLRPEAEAV